MTSVWQIIYVGGLSITLFLCIMIVSKRQKSVADRILCAWFFFACIHLAFIGWYASGLALKNPQFILWQLPFPFLHGPFLYLYILFLSAQQRYRWRYLLHFIPALLVVVILTFVLPDVFTPVGAGIKILPQFEAFFQILVVAIILSGLTYVMLSLRLLHAHRRNIIGQLSNTDRITLNWIRYLIFGMSAIWVVVIFSDSPRALYTVVALFIFFIGYFGIRQVGVFSNLSAAHEVYAPALLKQSWQNTDPALPAEKSKYEKTRLKESDASLIHGQLKALMKEQKCYQDPELTLGDLAKRLNLHPVILSQVINSKEGKSFYDYVNSHRVEAFKELLLDPKNQQFTLLSLAFDCGFNSKTSFNRNFKKITQMSPSAYAKTQQFTLISKD